MSRRGIPCSTGKNREKSPISIAPDEKYPPKSIAWRPAPLHGKQGNNCTEQGAKSADQGINWEMTIIGMPDKCNDRSCVSGSSGFVNNARLPFEEVPGSGMLISYGSGLDRSQPILRLQQFVGAG
jgi:hypothetical protein